ncbi:hypothetical protein QTG54_009024 [Skeletonema marinoi]|uniref:RING-CH-type domain-containing protein n=1 Tax=Skeletonema marinoi TaxID=267567 RepID=A0AAD8Y6T1_9STRA|nr:hypothetical protein QTG54_009024 [Skeletonema marinoi]
MSSASQSTSVVSITPPDGASCWLCLEEGPDDSGAPLVRDCSCRGHSGFAHLPCLIQYAESKSRDLAERGALTLREFFQEKIFEQCPNCKQTFQGNIPYGMTTAQLAFFEREFKDVQSWQMGALMKRIHVLDGRKDVDRIEGEEICTKMLSLIDEMKKNSDPSLDVLALATIYQEIGIFYYRVDTKQSLKKGKRCLEISRDIVITFGGRELQCLVEAIKNNLANVEARLSGVSIPNEKESDLSSIRARYNCLLQAVGQNDIRTIEMGTLLASKLFNAYHTIEASRLLDRLVIISCRVHGSDHKQTKIAESWRQRLQLRCAFIGSEQQPYQALRYEDDGDSCIVQGPVPKNVPRNDDDCQTFSVPSVEISFSLGTPVMLHGLKKAAHLNGEIGDVREYCKLSGRCVVHLEDKDLKPVKVKHENLRIVFDLPDPKNLD